MECRNEELGTEVGELRSQKNVLVGDLKSTVAAQDKAVRFKQQSALQGVGIAMNAFKNVVVQVSVLNPGLDLSLVQPLHEVCDGRIVKP